MVWGGMYDSALLLLKNPALGRDPDDQIKTLALQGTAETHLQRLSAADADIKRAEHLCANESLPSCGGVLRARGLLSLELGNVESAQASFLESLSFSRSHHDKPLEGTALQNLGSVSLQQEHFDEAVDWITSGYRVALQLGDDNLAQIALGNLGWAYFRLGDSDRALDLTLQAENRAEKLGSLRMQINWVTTAANIYGAKQDWPRAMESYKRALVLARKLNMRGYVINALEDLAHTSIDAGRLNDAEDCIQELQVVLGQTGDPLDALDVKFARARIASLQHQWNDAEQLLQAVDEDPHSQASMRMGAEHALAQLYESSGDLASADHMYHTALETYESARDSLKNEDSELPFLVNAATIYDDYIHFLIEQGKPDMALRIADQSRAQTLAQGLGVTTKIKSIDNSDLRPAEIARKTRSTLLFYWLGEKQSYLWAITPNKTSLYTLPARQDISRTVERYRKALLGIGDPLENSDADGLALYRMLVAPASEALHPDSNVIVLTDGALSLLNFETLIVPGPRPHYLIEDAVIISAPSLHLLGAANSPISHAGKLLLIGDAISPNPDYPDLPMASSEMKQIEQHFTPQNETIFSRDKATADAYVAANPQQFAYIHFVAHGVASRTDPLDSAVILSRASPAEDSFKLHAREIIQHPVHANLVTVSACYGSGTRSYAGEGSIGLAWAFLRAGAHNVIGALWEVSDESTPELMSNLYEGLQKGEPPSTALHLAKLNLLHSHTQFRKPFYWAPLQIYTGL